MRCSTRKHTHETSELNGNLIPLGLDCLFPSETGLSGVTGMNRTRPQSSLQADHLN